MARIMMDSDNIQPGAERLHMRPAGRAARLAAYFGAVVVVLIPVGLAFVVDRFMPYAGLSLLFLTGVLIVAARTGLGRSLFASALSFLACNHFFTTPDYTFEVENKGGVSTLQAVGYRLAVARRRTGEGT
jgi:K+-sensing histidine kinase KdpD